MMIDARQVPTGETLETDICIVGAGPAGIAAAKEFLGKDIRVCLLETGGLEYSEPIQQLTAGEGQPIGDFYPEAYYMRHREFGGTGHRWSINLTSGDRGVRYVTFDPIDFEKKDWLPYSGWPFNKAHLDPYYARAHETCKIGRYTYEAEDWADETAPQVKFPDDALKTKVFHCGSRGVFLRDYREEFKQASNITTCLYGTVKEIETDDSGHTVTRLQVATLEGNQFYVSAKAVILAMGGIEVARLMLLSNKTHKNGLGNQYDLVGRFLMDHQMVRCGWLVPFNRKIFDSMALYDLRPAGGSSALIGKFLISEAIMRQKQLLNTATAIFPRASIYRWNPLRILFPNGKTYRSKAVKSAQALLQAARQKQLPPNLLEHVVNLATGVDDMIFFKARQKVLFNHPTAVYGFDQGGWSDLPDKEKKFGLFEVTHLAEQAPDPNNRVTLGTELDALGQPKVKIYWRWNEIDIHSIKQTQEVLAAEFARAGLGQLKIERDKDIPQLILPSIHHHMGTTRIHEDPKQGVVDANCKVHGISNLYIASGSTFPTGSYANPTLTIIAMSIRVADRVKQALNI